VRSFLNIVPTSAHSGDGMMDLLFLLSTLPSKMLTEKIMYHENLECTVHPLHQHPIPQTLN
jgi:translation initiation factor 5B